MYKFVLYSCATLLFANALHADAQQQPLQELSDDKVTAMSWRADKNNKKKDINLPSNKGFDLSIAGEFLYWQSTIGGYIYTETGYLNQSYLTFPAGGALTNDDLETGQGTAYSPPTSFHPGFRAILSTMPDNKSWGMSARYLWFYSSDQRSDTATNRKPFQMSASSAEFDLIILEYGSTTPDYFPTKTSFDWHQHYQVGDLLVERTYFANKHLKLRPFAGARGTWQKKTFNLTYGYAEPIVANPANNPQYAEPPFEIKTKNHNKDWGVGIVGGLESSWYFNKNISIYGSFAVSELWMRQEASVLMDVVYIGEDVTGAVDPESLNPLTPVTSATFVNVVSCMTTIKPMFDCSLGLRAEADFSDGDYHFAIQAGWEAQYWPNQILFLHAADSASAGLISSPMLDLALQGLTAKIQINF